jgi:integrase/recombinase XerC
VKKREITLTVFGRWLAPKLILDAEVNEIEDWLDTRRLIPASRAWHVANLASFFGWAVRNDYVVSDPTVKVIRPRLPSDLPRPIGTRDLKLALDLAQPRMRVWLSFACYAGFRCQEIAGQKREDVWESEGLIHVSAPKGGRKRRVPLHADLHEALVRWGWPRKGPLFPGRAGPTINQDYVSHMISAYLADLGINATAHMLRHWFGTRVYEASHDLLMVQELLGHSSVTTTKKYVEFSSDETVPVVRGLHVGSLRGSHQEAGPDDRRAEGDQLALGGRGWGSPAVYGAR